MDEEYGMVDVPTEDMLDATPPPGGSDEPGLSLDDFQSSLKYVIDDAVDYAEEDLAETRQTNMDAYRGVELSGDCDLDETRSRAMSKDVHDTVHAMLPSLLRVFFSGQAVVEYMPEGPEDEEGARQATDYVNKIILSKDNDGFMVFYNAFKDALIKQVGVFKWWWDEDFHIEAAQYSGLDEMTFQVLAGDPHVSDIYDFEQDEMGLISCTVARKLSKGGFARVEAVPPEERLIDRKARSIQDSDFYGHRRIVTVSDLVAMGFSYEQVSQLGGVEELETNEEVVERYDNQVYQRTVIPTDPSQREVELVEGYVKADLDADGVAELYKVCVGGVSRTILLYEDGSQAIELVDEIPFAEICPDPEPHLATGHAIAEQVVEIQTIKTNLLRGTLDSLSRSIFPREEVVEMQVNMDDVLNPEIGAVIRAKAPGMVREITTPFMGRECLPVMEYMDQIKADRTGISDATQGLNPDALQSSTAAAVDATVSASQSQLEMVARIFAQTGITRLFKGLLKMVTTHQDQARTVRMNDNWVPVDPRAWNAGMDACVTTALGRGTDSQKMAMLNMVAERQQAAIAEMGPVNQLCTMAEYRATLAEMVTLAGYYNPDKFFLPVEQQQIVEQFMGQMQELQGQLDEVNQQNVVLATELQKHTQAEDDKNMADADLKRMQSGKVAAETFDKIVEAAQRANQEDVEPGAADDEMNVHRSNVQ